MKARTKRTLTDDQLMKRVLRGCSDSFEVIVERYEAKVFNTALYLTSSVEDAESVLHQVFCDLFERIKADFGKNSLFHWLIQHAMDISVQRLIARHQGNDALPQTIRISEPFAEHVKHFEENHRRLRHAILDAARELSLEFKQVFLLRDVLGLTTSKTAELLRQDVFSVRAALHAARLQVRARMAESIGTEAAATSI